ncbi:MAG: hypothetical protein JXQ29_01325 [Planctomycetes bacterium]|nr:hypothetical protein [Planctomycetota bacterium]
MSRTFLAIALCALVSAAAAADEIYVPGNNPTLGGGNNWPWNATTSSEWRYQLLFTATQLGHKAGIIKDIAFAPTTTGTHTSQKFEMTFSHTSATALSSTWAANLPWPVVVYPEGPLTWNPVRDTWSPLGLRQSFVYDGQSNLVVDLRYLGGAMSGGFTGVCHSDSGWSVTILRSWRYGAGAYSGATALTASTTGGLITRFTMDVVLLIGSGSTRPGGKVTLALQAPADGGLPYQLGTSFGLGPTPIGARTLQLSLDDLLVVSVGGKLPAVFQNYSGRLDTKGEGQGAILIPNDRRLLGLRLHTAFLTLDGASPQGVRSISEPFTFSVTP